MGKHLSNVVAKASSDMFAPKTLKNHGLGPTALSHICRATLINRLLYTSPAWRGFCTVAGLARLDSVEQKARKWDLYCVARGASITSILDSADDELFQKVMGHGDHVLCSLLPPVKQTGHWLRPRGHSLTLP